MLDEFSRNIDYLRISITDRCNLRCIYCMPEEGVCSLSHDEILSYEQILHLCELFAKLGVHKIKITGGEPLVRRDCTALIKAITQIKGIDNVTLTTNGLLLEEKLEELIEAGISSINVSLDTTNDELYQKITRFQGAEQVIKSLKKAANTSLNVKVNAVPLADVKDEDFYSLVELAKEDPIHVRFIELMPIGLGQSLKGQSQEELMQRIEARYGVLKPYSKQLGNGPCVYYTLEGFKGKIGFIAALSHKFCSQCNRVRLTADGLLKTCLQYDAGCNLKKLLDEQRSDEEIIEMIRKTILLKPQSHHFESAEKDSKKETRMMSQIGG